MQLLSGGTFTGGAIKTKGQLFLEATDINLTSGITAGGDVALLSFPGGIHGSGVVTTPGNLVVFNNAPSSITTSLVSNFGGALGADLTITQMQNNNGVPMTIGGSVPPALTSAVSDQLHAIFGIPLLGSIFASLGVPASTTLGFFHPPTTLTINTPAPLSSLFGFFPTVGNIANLTGQSARILLNLSENITTLGTDSAAIAALAARGINVVENVPKPPKPIPTPPTVPPTLQPQVPPQAILQEQTQATQRAAVAAAAASAGLAKIFESPKTSLLSGSLALLAPNYTAVIAQKLDMLPLNISDIASSGASVFSIAGGMIKIDSTSDNKPEFLKGPGQPKENVDE